MGEEEMTATMARGIRSFKYYVVAQKISSGIEGFGELLRGGQPWQKDSRGLAWMV